jgi:hypothetical protein
MAKNYDCVCLKFPVDVIYRWNFIIRDYIVAQICKILKYRCQNHNFMGFLLRRKD